MLISSNLQAVEPLPETLNALQTTLDRVSSAGRRSDLPLEGAASCAATACHGGPRAGIVSPAASRGSEYPLWFENDPHALSWRTFCSQASVAMMERLKIMEKGKVIDKAGYDNCLACHNTTRQFQELRSAEHLTEGVGCASCHGPSQQWRSTHFQAGWDPAAALDVGFAPTKNMLARARICASCHVGDRDRDMNHDIIAAGHPALHYEFTTFHQRQPKHWRDENANDSNRYEASMWLAGQVAALDASLVLLEARTTDALPVSQWPEFAAHDCSACHQQLRIGNFDYSRPRVPTGLAELSHWNRYGVEELLQLRQAEGRGTALDHDLSAAIEQLAKDIQAVDSEAAVVARSATAVRKALDSWINSPTGLEEMQNFTAQRLKRIVLSSGNKGPHLQSWERTSQFYLASIAARAAWPQATDGKSTTTALSSARHLRDTLTFRQDSNSPKPLFRSNLAGQNAKDGVVPPEKAIKDHLRAIFDGDFSVNFDQSPLSTSDSQRSPSDARASEKIVPQTTKSMLPPNNDRRQEFVPQPSKP